MTAPATASVENPNAFPFAAEYGHPAACEGMTLRDYFAGQVLASAAALPYGTGDYLHRAKVAYDQADVMLVARATPRSTGLEIEQAAPGTGEKLLKIARQFIDKHQVSCAEATGEDGVYADAPLLVEALAEVVGYYSYPDEPTLRSAATAARAEVL